MNKVRLTSMEDGKVFLLQEPLEDPTDTQVQVEVYASVVSPGTERAFIKSLENTDRCYPRVLGYSAAGVVVKVGAQVSGFKPGDRVAGVMPHTNIANVEQRNLVHIPEGVSFEQACFVRIGVISMQAVRKARIELGESVAVLGLGLIGQTAVQLAKVNGACPAVGLDVVPEKMKLAQDMGCAVTLDSRLPDLDEKLKEACGGDLPQVVIESTGFPGPIAQALKMVRRLGRVVILGSTRGCTEVNFYADVHKKGIDIIGAHISANPVDVSYPGYWTFRDNANCFLHLIKEKRFCTEGLTSQKGFYKDYDEIYHNVLEKAAPDYITSVILWK